MEHGVRTPDNGVENTRVRIAAERRLRMLRRQFGGEKFGIRNKRAKRGTPPSSANRGRKDGATAVEQEKKADPSLAREDSRSLVMTVAQRRMLRGEG